MKVILTSLLEEAKEEIKIEDKEVQSDPIYLDVFGNEVKLMGHDLAFSYLMKAA